MSRKRHHYGPRGDYKGYSTNEGPGWSIKMSFGEVVAICLFVIAVLAVIGLYMVDWVFLG
jgi:hypothetical protein